MRVISLSLALAGALALAGCKDTDRPLSYDKGVYGGKMDTKLTSEQIETLRHRGMRQAQ
jgi:outer membrane protein assembly factor BamE (lipoprotein component of BamABCDE complex)